MDAMIGRIRHRQEKNIPYRTDVDLSKIRVETLQTLRQLRDNSRVLADPVGYLVSRNCVAVRDLGDSIGRGEIEKLYLPAHVNGNHWTVFLLDFRQRQLYYGDSFGGSPSPTDVANIQRWIRLHQQDSLREAGTLPIASQPTSDGISCGILVINAINHVLFGDKLWTPATRELLRIEQYLEIAEDYIAAKRQHQVRTHPSSTQILKSDIALELSAHHCSRYCRTLCLVHPLSVIACQHLKQKLRLRIH